MSVDDGSLSSINKHIINIPSTPNTPNFTQTSGNTSQSMTPSEFGYHNLNRQSAAITPDVSPKSPIKNIYEEIKDSFSGCIDDDSSSHDSIIPKNALANINTPLKSTINIIFKSPLKNVSNKSEYIGENIVLLVPSNIQPNDNHLDYQCVIKDEKQRKPLLETSFDENMVYEQINLFKSAVSKVNLLFDNGNVDGAVNIEKNADNNYTKNLIKNQIVPNVDIQHLTINNKLDTSNSEENSNLLNQDESYNENIDSDKTKKIINAYELQMSDSDIHVHVKDTSELELEQDISFYENLELTKQGSDSKNVNLPNPCIDYENVNLPNQCSDYENVNLPNPCSDYENIDMKLQCRPKDILANCSTSSNIVENIVTKPSKFIVRQLANKFETIMPSLDFSISLKKKIDNNRNSPCMIYTKNHNLLHNSAKITRSLDEYAFIREFGKIDQNEQIKTKKTSDLTANDTLNSSSRRMSLEFILPKSLNPPKRLPNLSDTKLCQYENEHKALTKFSKTDNNDSSNYNLKITPTTENPISLIQHNVNFDISNSDKVLVDDEKKSAFVGNVITLGSFKLDRERIEKIKEERRHQLNEKFRSESFKSDDDCTKAKSKSKTELRDIKYSDKANPLRFKSKSRADVRSIRDITTECAPIDIMKSLGIQNTGSRMRRINDDKNQNDCNNYVIDSKQATKTSDICDKFGTNTKGRQVDWKDIDTHRHGNNEFTSSKVSISKSNSQ